MPRLKLEPGWMAEVLRLTLLAPDIVEAILDGRVTTNFDLHFEAAASMLFGSTPEVYRAPALPLGYDFTGIVHVHGALPRVRDLVLTDADFGRAYLTEGWAQRCLVAVFGQFTVLFVGYSHNDVVMHYLARALPADGVAGRFALTEEDGSWDLLGIRPIRFTKGTGADAYNELYDGVQPLAERAARGAASIAVVTTLTVVCHAVRRASRQASIRSRTRACSQWVPSSSSSRSATSSRLQPSLCAALMKRTRPSASRL